MANNPYVNKVVYGNNTVMDLTEDTVTPNDVLRGVTFHDKSGASQTGNLVTHNVIDNLNSDSSEDALSARMGKKVNLSSNQKVVDAVGWDGRNYFHVDDTVVSGTDNGITYTITRKNGEVTRIRCNGTPTSGDFTLWLGSWTYGGTSPILTGCPSGGGSQGTIVNYGMSATQNGGYQSVATAGDEPAKLYEYFAPGSISISIIIKSGYTASNLDFYPMICSEELSDYNFKPHHDSVETLLGKKQNTLTFDNTPTAGSDNPVKSSGIKTAIDTSASNVQSAEIDLLKDTVGWTGKNLINTPYIYDAATTRSGVTITPIENGVIKLNGTASADDFYPIHLRSGSTFDSKSDNAPLILEAGSYILTKDSSKVDIRLLKTVSGSSSTIATLYTNQTSVEFTLDAQTQVGVMVDTKNTTAYSNELLHVMIRKSDIADSTYEPYHTSVKQTLRDAEVIKGKNLLENLATSKTISGITFTVNSDGSVNVNGTASADLSIAINNILTNDVIVAGNKYILSGCPSGGAENKYYVRLGWKASASDTWGSLVARDVGSGVEFTAPSSTYGFLVHIGVTSGQTVSNLVFKPMIRLASESDPTYEPYYIPLKDSKFDRAEQRVLGAKNLLNIPSSVVTTTHNNVTFTVYRDGTSVEKINVNGTSPSDNYGQLLLTSQNYGNSTPLFPNKRIKFSLKGATDGVHFVIGKGSTIISQDNDVELDGNDVAWVFIRLNSSKSANTDVYPMIRLASDPDNTYVPYAMTNKELTDSKDKWSAEATVSNGSVTFSGLDDTQGWAYDPYGWIDGNSVELNPSFTLTTISGAGTSNMTLIFSTNADSGSRAILRIIK